MICLPEPLPYGRTAVEIAYGDPYEEDFYQNKLVHVKLPYFMVLSWAPQRAVKTVAIHKLIAGSFVDALEDILSVVGEDKLHELGWDRFGGSYNFRPKTCNRELSTHSWGIAVDLNPHLGRYGKPADGYPQVIRNAFIARGWVWGGRWQVPDGMHFQACRGY